MRRVVARGLDDDLVAADARHLAEEGGAGAAALPSPPRAGVQVGTTRMRQSGPDGFAQELRRGLVLVAGAEAGTARRAAGGTLRDLLASCGRTARRGAMITHCRVVGSCRSTDIRWRLAARTGGGSSSGGGSVPIEAERAQGTRLRLEAHELVGDAGLGVPRCRAMARITSAAIMMAVSDNTSITVATAFSDGFRPVRPVP